MASSSSEQTLYSIMKSPLRPLPAETSVHDALRFSERCGMHHLTLFQDDELLGVVCTCDLEEVALDSPVGQAIKRPAVVLDGTASLSDAVHRMSDELVGSVLVVDAGRAVGIVTRHDAEAHGAPLAPFHCESCGATAHLRRRGNAVLCGDCRDSAAPASLDEDELGGSG